ncbi:hypothetical protein R9X49_14115 [Pectobacterium carotovorum]|uniref:hypothetical protein n=1 Tax=Pectobacterium carotovorum TaxID=554 RepID=UPI0021C3FC07|nr:hypothetical protein [Pectobacterium carotovorum]MDX6916239.1 hypothetical protein [Pectobacterium carotovorum]GKW07922.1 membrane protein [Pectobacterium carotovorum subsp. carotovorum]
MLKGMGSFIGMSVLLLGVGVMAGYISGGTTWETYRAVARGMRAFWWASGSLFVAGIIYRIAFNRLSGVCGVLFSLAIAVALILTGFHYAIGGGWWR